MSLATLQGGRGISFDDYFKQALNLDVSKLEAIIRGQDHSMPIVAAMAAYEVKKPMATAAAGQQAQQQLQQAQPTVRQKMEKEMAGPAMIPDMAMLQQQRMGPQPPVLPEQGGVGALPAPNMQGMAMAHGGIIAFDDGGYIPGYAGDDENLVEEETSSPVGRFFTDLFSGPEGARERYAEQQKRLKKERELAAKEFEATGGGFKQQTKAQRAEAERIAKERKKLAERPPAPAAVLTTPPPAAINESAAETARLQRQAATPSPISTVRSGAPSVRGAPAPSTPDSAGPTGIEGILDVQKKLAGPAEKEFRSSLADYDKAVQTGVEALRKTREQGKPTGEAYSKLETSLQKEEGEAAGKEERNLRMALVNAGLAIAGGTSRYALENIGKGALVGTKQYMDGIDKLEAAAKKRQEAMAMIEQARRAEARDDWKAKNEAEAKYKELELNAKKTSIEGLGKIFQLNTEASTTLYNNMQTNASREKIARDTNAAHLAGQRIMANAYGQRKDPYDTAWDNATKAMQVQISANPTLLMQYQQNPQKYQADFNALLQQALNRTTDGAIMPGGSGLKFLGFEKQ